MAISLLKDAQARGIAAALVGIKREQEHLDHHRALTMTPPKSANTSSSNAAAAMYPAVGLQQAAAASAAFSMLSPQQMLAANHQAAAVAYMAQMPISALASTLFHHHPSFFGNWHHGSHLAGLGQHSPPTSPHSPVNQNNNGTGQAVQAVHTPLSGKHPHPSPGSSMENLDIECGEMPAKKARKCLSSKKDSINSSTNDLGISSINELYHTPGGPISPPSSGSSPNSTHDAPALLSSGAHTRDPSRDKSFTCKICSRSFGYKHVLQNHERTHTGEKPFECPECHKRFTRDHHLKTHMRLHTGEKPYHCSHCDRQFVQVANLRRHLRVHTGERPYTCDICDGKFSDSNQLKSHQLVHNGEKPFDCERCHGKFRRRHHLVNHKCEPQSRTPPTPALSPALSGAGDYERNCCNSADNKSSAHMCSSYGSEESIDINMITQGDEDERETAAHELAQEAAESTEAPLDLSEDASSEQSASARKQTQDICRIFRLPPPQILHVVTTLPEQTEPEDLSMRSPPLKTKKLDLHDTLLAEATPLPPDELAAELDELDDAATLYLRQQQLAAASSWRYLGVRQA